MTTALPDRPTALRNTLLLALVQALGGSNQSIIMTVAALTAMAMAPDPALATVPVTAMIVGLALASGPVALLIFRLGRTRGLMAGAAFAVPSSLVASLAVVWQNFGLFVAACFCIGASAAAFQQLRFAAADSVPPEFKARAISIVLFGGVAAGFFGPQLSNLTRTWLPVDYAASYLVIAALSLLSIFVLSFTRLPPVVRAGRDGASGRPMKDLLKTGAIVVPMIAGALTYSLMTLIMVAAPIAMVHLCGHPPAAAAGAIQWHVVAMFAPSFVTGAIIARLGAHLVTAMGLVMIMACAAIALNGISLDHFNAALVLLGVGWNFGFIGATAMLTAAYRPEEAGRVQALNEQVVFGVMALASIGSGVLLEFVGWEAINAMALPVAGLAIALVFWSSLTGGGLTRRPSRAAIR